MKHKVDQRLIDAIERNTTWIKKRCRLDEFNPQLQEELFQEIMFSILNSSKTFAEQEIRSADAWVKGVASNRALAHKRDQLKRSELAEYVEFTDHAGVNSAAEVNIEMKSILEFIDKEFNAKDSEIMRLYVMKENNNTIAEIFGMSPGSVANTVMKLKSRVNEFINRGNHEH